MLTWTQPQGTWYEFRLVANRYGYPVDQNDGSILIDSTTYPGSSYADQAVIPGSYHYYGIYMRVNNIQPYVWQRCAFASCLAPASNGMGTRMFDLLPVYFRELLNGDLTTDAAGDQYLVQYLQAIGWGMDYLKTQYDVLYQHLNDPMAIPLDDLVNLADELGMPFQPELPAHLMRKALANWTHVSQERGTPGGISEHMTLLTGYPIDLQSGRNKMLEHDQATPADPVAPQWSAYISYVLNEMVTYQNFLYKCIQATTNLGNPPTGSTSANTWWTVVQNTTDPNSTLHNANTVGGVNTWQALYPALDNGGNSTIPSGTLVNTIGMVNPINTPDNHHGAFSVFNKQGTTQDIMLRSISQIASDRTAAGTNTNMAPDPLQAVSDGVPIPRINTQTNGWLPTTRYATNDIVLWDGILYQALRASTGETPPSPGTPINANPYFETSVSPWTATNATVTQSATQVFQGSHSMLLTPDGVHANPQALSESFAVVPGATYVAASWVWISSAWPNTLLYVVWLDPFGATISTSNFNLSVAATTWTQLSEVVTAPANAAKAFIALQLTGSPAGSVLSYWDGALMSCSATPEWAVLSTDNRLRMMMSGYADGPASTVQVVPFLEWYDEGGNLIVSNGQARVLARTATPGTAGIAPNLTFDSFTFGAGTFLNGRQTDTQDQIWTTQLGSWAVSGFSGGSVYPASAGVRSMATVTGLAGASGIPIWLGLTYASTVPSGTDAGIIFRWVSTSSYWRAGMTGLYLVTAGTAALIGTYSTPCQPGDRLVVNLNGNNITVYRNGSSVLSTSSATNATATVHGIAVEATGV